MSSIFRLINTKNIHSLFSILATGCYTKNI